MDSDNLIGAIIGLVIVGCVAFISLYLFGGMVSSSLALEPGDPYYITQRGLILAMANNLHRFVGGIGLVVTALAGLLALGRGR